MMGSDATKNATGTVYMENHQTKQNRLNLTKESFEALALDSLRRRALQKERLNALLKAEFVSSDAEELTVTLRFPVEEWELNPAGNLHGGMSASMMDIAMGVLAHSLAEGRVCTTTSLSMQYLRPVPKGEFIIAEAKAEFAGRNMMNFTAKGMIESSGKTAFTAQAGYFVLPTLTKDAWKIAEKE